MVHAQVEEKTIAQVGVVIISIRIWFTTDSILPTYLGRKD